MSKINETLQFATAQHIQLSEVTRKALDELQNPHYTVAVVGRFQVGKSTMINNIFLEEEILLKQGDGRCTTAIMTKVVYGPEKRLTVFYRDPSISPRVYTGNEINECLIASLTVADDPDETERQRKRTELANTVKYIQLEYPCDTIKQYSFYDTPGIDDPNQELIDLTTLQFLSDTDLVILVVDASRQLDVFTKQFLSRSVFQEGHSRVLILASYRPECNLTPEMQNSILKTIQSELVQMGRGYIPVLSYTFDQNVEGNLLHGAVEIRSTIMEYIEKNKYIVREERLAWFLRNDILKEIERLKAIILTNTQNEQERTTLKEKIDRIIVQLDVEYNNTLNNFKMKYLQVKIWMNAEVERRVLNADDPDSVLSLFLKRFEKCDSLAEVRSHIDPSVQYIKSEVDYVFAEIGQEAKQKVESILNETSDQVSAAAQNVKLSTQWDAELNPGWGGRIHPAIVRVIEVAIGYGFFNILGAIGVLVSNKIPFVKNLLPSAWLKQMVVKSLQKSFVDSIESAKKDISRQFEDSQQAIEGAVKEMYQEIYQLKVAPYEEQLKLDGNPLSDAEITALNEKIKEYIKIADELIVY